LYQAIKKQGRLEVEHIGAKDEIVSQVAGSSKSGDIVLTLGAGDIYKVGDALVAALR
jgi:UDP-N-acetylmuramate--alanine ligase